MVSAAGWIVIETEAVFFAPSLSVTCSENASAVGAATGGAVKRALAWSTPVRETAVPLVCDQAYSRMLPSGSLLVLPSRLTFCPGVAVSGASIRACGDWLAGATGAPALLPPPPPPQAVSRTASAAAASQCMPPHGWLREVADPMCVAAATGLS